MIAKPIVAILVAALVAASGAIGSFYFAGAQEQAAVEKAEITVDEEAQAGSEIEVGGSNFGANSDVSIYFMSAARADLTNGSAFILQEVSANETTAAEAEGGNFFEDALNALSDLLGLNSESDATTTSASQGSLLVVLAELANGTMSLECGNEGIAESELNSTNLVSLAASSGTYEECSISIAGDNGTDTGEIGSLTVTLDPDEGYESGQIANATADDRGSFAQSVTLPQVEEGAYAILAASEEGTAAVSEISVTAQPAAEAPGNATEALNQTAPLPEGNVTAEQNQTLPAGNATEALNETEGNQTAASAEPTVQVEETEAEPGDPLAISGDGFEPNAPVQIFINNIQITNIITNIEGSFNTVVIIPTTVNAGNMDISVRTDETDIAENVNIVQPDDQPEGPATLRFTSVSATDNAEALENAPVTIFDTSSGEVVESDKTPMEVELEAGTYSVFYSDFRNFDFESAEPGRWTDTADGGSGLITVKEGRNATVTAMYSEEEAPPPPPRKTVNSITLQAEDTDGEPLEGMFATIYDAETGEKVEQGFTELTVEDLPPGTYPVFFANFAEFEFLSASPGDWVQTPFGGAGLVTIPDDGEDHNVVVTAVYDRVAEAEVVEEFNIQAPLDIRGDVFTITSNETRPEGPFVMSGSFALRVNEEDPVRASLSAFIVSAREDSNENVMLDSQRSRDHDTFQIVDFKPRVARPVGLDSYVVSGTADLLLNGDVYSNDERIEVMVRGGEALAPTNVEIEFQGDERYSGANRLETLYGAVTSGFQ
jgi:hypothetical protein